MHTYRNDDARDRFYYGDLFYKMAAEWLLYNLYLYSTVLPGVLESKFYNIIAQLFSMLVFPLVYQRHFSMVKWNMALTASLDKILFWDTIVSFDWLCLQMCSEDNLLVVHFARGFSPGQVKLHLVTMH